MPKSKDWKTAEHIAALLEKALAPNAKVEHNVMLPVLGQPGREPRQCDVVITYGTEPRTSRTLVEVQKRKSKPDITTFHGWLEKMREVGAQQLICVSEKGYPRSIIDDVALRVGPTVRLMTLRQVEEGDVITQFIMLPDVLHTNRTFEIVSIGTIEFKAQQVQDKGKARELGQFSTDDEILSLGKDGPLISVNGLIANALTNSKFDEGPPVPERSFVVNLLFKAEHDVWLHRANESMHVHEWSIQVKVLHKTTKGPKLKIDQGHLVYHQQFENDVVAWVATSKFELEGAMMEIRLVFKPNADGYLTVSGDAYTQPPPFRTTSN